MPPVHFLISGPKNASRTVALTHGATAGIATPFLHWFSSGLAKRDFRVVEFEFPYMVRRYGPAHVQRVDPESTLIETWRQVIRTLGSSRLVIGGKSLGGRIASLVADEQRVAGVICLGYRFHPPGEPKQTHFEHLKSLKTPTLILQGSHDPFGSQANVAGDKLSPSVQVVWLADGDHEFRLPGSAESPEMNWAFALEEIVRFIDRVLPRD